MSGLLPRRSSLVIVAAVLAAALRAAPARADVSSWLLAGGGASTLLSKGEPADVRPALQLDTGVGSSPAAAFAVGGLARLDTAFGRGSSFALLLRTATGGYVRGDFGLAVDLGGYTRLSGSSPLGLTGGLSLGAPWGITLNLTAGRGEGGDTTLGAVLGLDFARFTAYRTTGLGWFPNPYPAVRPDHGGS